MFTFQKIPVEIHYKVLELLPKESILECMLVSRYWSTLAIPAYYNTIYLSGTNIEFLNSKLLLDDNDQDQQFAYGSLVKSLISPEFYCAVDAKFSHYNSESEEEEEDEEEEEEEEEYFLQTDQQDDDSNTMDEESFALIPVFSSKSFLKLLSYMPNLKKIDLFTSAYYEFYMTILASQGNKYLHHIEDISIHAVYHELHFTACYQFRRTLTHLEVYYATYYVDHLFGDPLYFLPHFKQLTNITLKNFERQDLTLFDILVVCPHLTVLDFDTNFDVSDRLVHLSFKSMLDAMIDIPANSATVALHSNLKILDLTLPKLSSGYIRYLTHYTDMKQLHTLSITLFDSHFDDWIKLNSIDTVTDFIKRLSRITHLHFCTRFVSRGGSLDELVEANCFQEFLGAVQVFQPVYYETYSNQFTH